jgi:triosephosphate isomerase
MKALYVINFKAYEETIGENGLRIAKTLDGFARETGESIMVAVQPTDIRLISKAVSIPVLAECFDPVEPGSKTGHVTIESVVNAGAQGTLLNHSEHRIPPESIKLGIDMAKEEGKLVIVCAQDPDEVEALSRFGPDYVAFEPPELIGGDVSVSSAKPELIEESVKRSRVPVLVGAGVKTSKDVAKAIELGAKGVLVASGIVKKKDVKKAIEGLVL